MVLWARIYRGLLTAGAVLAVVSVSGCAVTQETPATLSNLDPLLINPSDETPDSLIENSVGQEIPLNAVVRANAVRLRTSDSLSSAYLEKLRRGTELKVLELGEDGWCLVETPEGLTGWVWGALIDIEGKRTSTARYKGMTHLLVDDSYYLGPDGKRRGILEVRGLEMRPPLRHTKLTSRFGVRKKHPVNGGSNIMHEGIDLKARVNTPVRAAASGVVRRVGRGPNYGLYVDIKHPLGFTTRYAHLKRALVYRGQRVKRGAIIARSGNTGATTGPHLHFEVHRDGRAVSPTLYVKGL